MTTNVQQNSFQDHLAAMEARIIALCEQDMSVADFYRRMLELTVNGLGEGGAIWQGSLDGQFNCVAHINLNLAGIEPGGAQFELLSAALSHSVETVSPLVLPENNSTNLLNSGLGPHMVNKANNSLIFVPIIIRKGQVVAVLVLIAPEGVDARALKGYTNFIAGLCDRAGFFLLKQEIRNQEKTIGYSDRLRQYSAALHSSLEPKRVCYALANYAQEMLGVYRCMAGTFNIKGKFRMQSVSGLESVAIKSNFIKTISEIAKHVCKNGKALIVDNPNAAMTDISDGDELLTAARCYMLEAKAAIMGIFPISADDKVVGVLVVERAQEIPFDQGQLKNIEILTQEAASALNNSLKYRDMPLSLASRALAVIRNKIYAMGALRKAIWACFLFIVFGLPAIIQLPVKNIGAAELIAIDGREVYVATDGQIDTVNVKEGDLVNKDMVLASLDLSEIESLIDMAVSKINQKQQAYDQAKAKGDAISEELLILEIAELTAQANEYKRKKNEELQIKSPVDGRIFTQQNHINKLTGMPVQRGQSILDVVPEDSPWEFIVNVPEDQAGDILKADYQNKGKSAEHKQEFKAHILMLACPDQIFEAKVLSISPRAHIETAGNQKYRNVISIRVQAPKELTETIDLRQGMKASVAIECGKNSLYYVVTRQFKDFWRVSTF
ncbi:MAG: HlyD family efflux transporter periplasmic adaptor subunit [Phycisphaerae bacterium]|nr:HlyD family efflux transporter periplasmic adaptor subunit [Phycisphaerae bacterium]